MGRRVDVVLLIHGVVFVVEFKVGASGFDSAAVEQAWDYALDLKNFHAASHDLPIVPVVVATDAEGAPPLLPAVDSDGVYRPLLVNDATFRDAIDAVIHREGKGAFDASEWLNSSYRPTPTIIEAARALYAQHSVEEIARHDAGAENLRVTSHHIEGIVVEAKRLQQKVICFVTGVPGAGKTLVGLNVATRGRDADAVAPAVYLSGNAPLVAVLREALTRDEVARQQALGNRARKGQVGESVKPSFRTCITFATT
ncbi:MAG: DNA/RNA helicase domain-containing protein [Acidobacteriota bacterium]